MREVEQGGVRWRAVEAWRGHSGHGLCYFLALEGGDVASDDRADRRAILEPEEDLHTLDDRRLSALLQNAKALTDTECRLLDEAGVPWLAQASGPVWADGGVASGLAGVVFTRLQGPFQRVGLQDDGVPAASAERLLALLGRARATAEFD